MKYSLNINHSDHLYSIRFPKSVLFLTIILLLLLALPYPSPKPTSAAGEALTISAPTTLSGTYGITATRFTDKANPQYYFEPAGTSVLNNITGNLSGTATTATNQSGGTVNATTGAFSGNVTFPGSGIWNSSGNVGIGTTAPGSKLTAAGNITAYSAAGQFVQLWSDNSIIWGNTAYGGGLRFGSASGESAGSYNEKMRLANGLSLGNGYVGTDPGAGNMIVQGNVGIGTTGPGYKLDVQGTGNFLNTLTLTGGNDTTYNINSWQAMGRYTGWDANMLYLDGYGGFTSGVSVGSPGASTMKFQVYGGTSYFGGNVGIGTTGPKGNLQVGAGYGSLTTNPYMNGHASATILHNAYNDGSDVYKWIQTHGSFGSRGIKFEYANSGIVFYADQVASTANATFTPTERMRIQNNGNVGIGTTGPNEKLTIKGGIFGIVSPNNTYRLYVTGGESDGTGSTILQYSYDGVIKNQLSTSGNSFLNGGNVGIGTTSPGYKLEVEGTIAGHCSGWSWSSPHYVCSDIAEIYPSDYSSSLEPGDILTMDPNGEGKVVKSTGSYQSTMIGIYSLSPGLLIGDNVVLGSSENSTLPDGKVPVALSGRVPVKISSNSTAINPGDFLTSSDEPGKATKATHAGQVIGKALESWNPNSGVDKILVFANLSYYNDPNLSLTPEGQVTVDYNVTPESVKYEQLTSLLTNAIQEQQAQIVSLQSITADFISKFKEGLIETKRLIVDGVDILKKLNELSVKVESQQKQIEELKRTVKELKK